MTTYSPYTGLPTRTWYRIAYLTCGTQFSNKMKLLTVLLGLKSPSNAVCFSVVNNELLANLRIKRNARLSETDMYLLLDYPISEDDLILVKKYRSALRDITNLDGAPWDGGGSETPWPEKPIVKPIDN